MVSCCKLLGIRSFVPEVRSWSGNNVPVNLYQTNVIQCPVKGKVPRHKLHPPRSWSWLRGGRSQLVAPSRPGPQTLPSCHVCHAPNPLCPQSPQVAQAGWAGGPPGEGLNLLFHLMTTTPLTLGWITSPFVPHWQLLVGRAHGGTDQ